MTLTLIPAAHDAAEDRALRGAAREVYLWALVHLSTAEFQPVKQLALAHTIGVHTNTVAHALRVLIAEGYVVAGPKTGRYITYRLQRCRRPRAA